MDEVITKIVQLCPAPADLFRVGHSTTPAPVVTIEPVVALAGIGTGDGPRVVPVTVLDLETGAVGLQPDTDVLLGRPEAEDWGRRWLTDQMQKVSAPVGRKLIVRTRPTPRLTILELQAVELPVEPGPQSATGGRIPQMPRPEVAR